MVQLKTDTGRILEIARTYLRNVYLTQDSRKIDMTYKHRQKKAVYMELRWKSDNTWFSYLQLYRRILYDLARALGWQNSVYIKSATLGYKKQGWHIKCTWFQIYRSLWGKRQQWHHTQSSLIVTKNSLTVFNVSCLLPDKRGSAFCSWQSSVALRWPWSHAKKATTSGRASFKPRHERGVIYGQYGQDRLFFDFSIFLSLSLSCSKLILLHLVLYL